MLLLFLPPCKVLTEVAVKHLGPWVGAWPLEWGSYEAERLQKHCSRPDYTRIIFTLLIFWFILSLFFSFLQQLNLYPY